MALEMEEARAKSLKKANRIRIARATLKREVKAGRDPIPILERPPLAARGMRVYELLTAVPKVGVRRADRLLVEARTSPNRTLQALTQGQRNAIIRYLRGDRGAEENEFSG